MTARLLRASGSEDDIGTHIEARRSRLAPDVLAERLASLQAGHDGLAFARCMVRFVERGL